jgi:predicted transcriptional regulator
MKKAYTLKLDEKLLEELKVQAEKENRSVSNLIETVLMQYVDDTKAKEWLNT